MLCERPSKRREDANMHLLYLVPLGGKRPTSRCRVVWNQGKRTGGMEYDTEDTCSLRRKIKIQNDAKATISRRGRPRGINKQRNAPGTSTSGAAPRLGFPCITNDERQAKTVGREAAEYDVQRRGRWAGPKVVVTSTMTAEYFGSCPAPKFLLFLSRREEMGVSAG